VAAPAYTVADVFRNELLLFNSQRGGDGKNNAKGVSKVMVDLYDLQAGAAAQGSLFDGLEAEKSTGYAADGKDRRITEALDAVNFKYGQNVLRTGSMVGIEGYIWDRIPFGGFQDLEALYAEEEPWPVPPELAEAAD